MAKVRLLLDTNIVIDFLAAREPHFEQARLLMILGRLGEFDLWVSSSQVTDIVYILSDGGRRQLMPSVMEQLRALRTFVNVCPVDECAIDRMLASAWDDPEDCLLSEIASTLKADAIVTRNQPDFKRSVIRACDFDELFAWLRSDLGLDYALCDL